MILVMRDDLLRLEELMADNIHTVTSRLCIKIQRAIVELSGDCLVIDMHTYMYRLYT